MGLIGQKRSAIKIEMSPQKLNDNEKVFALSYERVHGDLQEMIITATVQPANLS